jgi:hypothetical protein
MRAARPQACRGHAPGPAEDRPLDTEGWVADVDPLRSEADAERLGSAVAGGESRGRLGSVGTSVQLTQPDCSVASFDLTKRPASAYRSELLIITHQPNNGPHDMPGPVACSQKPRP